MGQGGKPDKTCSIGRWKGQHIAHTHRLMRARDARTIEAHMPCLHPFLRQCARFGKAQEKQQTINTQASTRVSFIQIRPRNLQEVQSFCFARAAASCAPKASASALCARGLSP